MRVAIVHSFYSRRVPSGENDLVEAHTRVLRDAGVEVELVSLSTDDMSSSPGYAARTGVQVMTGLGPSPVKRLEKFRPDIVHVHNLFPNWGTSWLKGWRGPMVATVHNYRPICAAGTLFRDGHDCTLCPSHGSHHAVKHRCYRGNMAATIPLAVKTRKGASGDPLLGRANRVIVLSDSAKAVYEEMGVASTKLIAIPNFVDDHGFSPVTVAEDHWVFLGRLTPEKGIVELLKAWPRTEHLYVYGDGPQRSAVEKMSNENVRVMGPINHDDVFDALSRGKGLVFPSQCREGAPLVYLESLAAGRPVISAAGNSVAEDICASGTGVVFDHWGDLRSRLDQLGAGVEKYAARARARYVSEFSKNVWVDRILKLYADVLHEDGK